MADISAGTGWIYSDDCSYPAGTQFYRVRTILGLHHEPDDSVKMADSNETVRQATKASSLTTSY